MAWFWTIVALVILLFFVHQKKKKKKMNKKLAPGPKGYPIFGSLHLLGEKPHRDLQKLADQYGPIMHMNLGLIPTTVVSSPRAAEFFLKTHDLVFATRPPHEAAKHISWEQRNLSFAPYGSYWRDIRKMCTLELLSSAKIGSFRGVRKEEVGLLIEFVRETAGRGAAIDLSAKIAATNADMSCRMVFGKKYSDEEFSERGFKAVVQEGMHLAAAPNFGDYVPLIAPLDLQGYTKRMRSIRKVFDDFFDKIIDEHITDNGRRDGGVKDFVDVMLRFMGSEESGYRIEKPNIKAIMLDMLVASMDTSATATEWAISELIKNQRALQKVQKELETVVGLDRMVEETDLEKLTYLDMAVKESMRLHPVAPLLLPHAATEDCTVDGFHVAKNSRVVVNVWAIGRDPKWWTEPEEFVPERFEGSGVDVRGRDFQLLPFGSGRRRCPGIQLGLTVVKLMVAQLVHCFDWELPDGALCSELDMTEEFGLTTPRANHLLAIPTYRLNV